MTGWSGPIARRSVLRAAGAVIALPMLEAMLPGRCLWTRTAAAATRATLAVPPARMMFVFLPNGVDIPSWPGSATAALADHAGKYSVLRNLCHRNAEALGDGAGDHARSAACFLTGAHPSKTSGAISALESAWIKRPLHTSTARRGLTVWSSAVSQA